MNYQYQIKEMACNLSHLLTISIKQMFLFEQLNLCEIKENVFSLISAMCRLLKPTTCQTFH